ncbi:uncharacterized protein JCM15063_000215 [Sporobolomyces koalae]|uniref:uncharacterized protein n=1 Tax=Sporobolomyces koalae TaxID=500713 RepID=UPI00317A8C88
MALEPSESHSAARSLLLVRSLLPGRFMASEYVSNSASDHVVCSTLLPEQSPPPSAEPDSPAVIRLHAKWALARLTRTMSPVRSRPLRTPSHQHQPGDCPPIDRQARVCYAVLTGTSHDGPVSQAKVKSKEVKRLKSELAKPARARVIVADLKRMEVGAEHQSASSKPRGFALSPLVADNASASSATTPTIEKAAIGADEPSTMAMSLPTSEGGIVGLATATTGVFEVMADVSGALVHSGRSREGLQAPLDSIAIFLYWWGYEISLPQSALVRLASAHSVQQTFFGFLQAFVVAGGAPELAPFIRYISNFLDMEFAAIQSQNKGGHGVVLAATWLLPVALVPRPWDFPVPARSTPASQPLLKQASPGPLANCLQTA